MLAIGANSTERFLCVNPIGLYWNPSKSTDGKGGIHILSIEIEEKLHQLDALLKLLLTGSSIVYTMSMNPICEVM